MRHAAGFGLRFVASSEYDKSQYLADSRFVPVEVKQTTRGGSSEIYSGEDGGEKQLLATRRKIFMDLLDTLRYSRFG